MQKGYITKNNTRSWWQIVKLTEHKVNLNELCRFFVERLKVGTVILFGSMARNDVDDTSDIDLLLVTSQKLRRREVKKMIPKSLLSKKKQLILSIYSEAEFSSAYEKGALFFAHLFNEGKVLYDDGFYKQLSLKPFNPSKRTMEMTIRILKQKLEVTNDLRKFNNLFIGVLADFFSIFKNLTYTLLAMEGQFIFNKKKAFSMLAEKYPNYMKEIRRLCSLEAFFLRNAKGISKPLPFSPYCEEKVIEMREQIEKLLSLGVTQDG